MRTAAVGISTCEPPLVIDERSHPLENDIATIPGIEHRAGHGWIAS